MRRSYLVIAALLIVSASSAPLAGQVTALKTTETPQKFENGLQIFWRNREFLGAPSDRDSTIDVLDPSSKRLASCNVTRALRQIDSSYADVSIYDVSARNPGYIAVAAVYARTVGDPVAMLLYFGWDGRLIRKLVLDQPPEIEKLEMDESGRVWALHDFDRDNPTEFVFTEFDSSGSVLNRFVRPRRSWSTQESLSKGGQVSFGLTAAGVWAWLPTSRTLISVDEKSGRTNIQKTGLPRIVSSAYVNARRAVLIYNGQLLMDVSWREKSQFVSQWFVWGADSGWKRVGDFNRNTFRYLYGLDGNDLIFSSNTRGLRSSEEVQTEPLSALLASTGFH